MFDVIELNKKITELEDQLPKAIIEKYNSMAKPVIDSFNIHENLATFCIQYPDDPQ